MYLSIKYKVTWIVNMLSMYIRCQYTVTKTYLLYVCEGADYFLNTIRPALQIPPARFPHIH